MKISLHSKIIFRDSSKHFLAKKSKRFAKVVAIDYVSLYSIDPAHLTMMLSVKVADKIMVIPASSVVKVLA